MMNTTVLLADDEVPFVDAMTRRLSKRNLDIRAPLILSRNSLCLVVNDSEQGQYVNRPLQAPGI